MPVALPPLTDSQIKQVRAMAGLGMSLEKVASVIDVSKSALYRMYKTDERLKIAYDSGKATVETKVAQTLVNKALDGHFGAIVWYEKTRCGRKEPAEISELEALKILIEAGMLPKEIAQLAASEIENLKQVIKEAITSAMTEQIAERLVEEGTNLVPAHEITDSGQLEHEDS